LAARRFARYDAANVAAPGQRAHEERGQGRKESDPYPRRVGHREITLDKEQEDAGVYAGEIGERERE
jgi:hypothetical protein